MDIIKANKCLRHWYGPPSKGTFNSSEVGIIKGEPTPQSVSPKEVLKARVAAYQKAMEEAAKAAAEEAAKVVAEAAPAEPEAIKLSDGDNKSSDEDAYAAFEAIEVEDEEAFV